MGKDYQPDSSNRVFYVNSQTKIEIIVEDDYCLYEMPDNTIAGLWRKLKAKAAQYPGWDVDVVTNTMWILKDECGSPVETFHIKEQQS